MKHTWGNFFWAAGFGLCLLDVSLALCFAVVGFTLTDYTSTSLDVVIVATIIAAVVLTTQLLIQQLNESPEDDT